VKVVAVAVWCLAVAFATRELVIYETSAGEMSVAPERWPGDSRVPRGPGWSVVMFVHPDCPCSRASLTELAAIASLAGGVGARIVIVFAGDASGSSWDRATQIGGALRIVDPGGEEARRFGARTSGHTVVFDGAGILRFSGGITGSRGHAGNNVGRAAVEKLLSGSEGLHDHAVFGCSMVRS